MQCMYLSYWMDGDEMKQLGRRKGMEWIERKVIPSASSKKKRKVKKGKRRKRKVSISLDVEISLAQEKSSNHVHRSYL